MAVEHSTNEIYRNEDMNRILTDDLNAIETNISNLQSGKADTTHTHTGYAAADHTHSGYAATDHTHTGYAASSHNHAQSEITGLETALAAKANVSHTHDYAASSHNHAQSDITGLTDALAGKATANHTHDYAASDHTHTATDVGAAPASHTHAQSDITGLADALAGKAAADHTHSGYAAADHTHTGYAASSHNHVMSAITGLLDVLMTDSTGGVSFSVTSGDMLSIIKGWDKGVYTAYFAGGTAVTNLPKTAESWRCIVHKTAALFGWVLAFGTSGSVYSNYLDNGTWKGWRAIYDVNPAPLWGSSGYYMTAGHTVTPSKKLSECAHGWLLLWSDYDPDTTTTNEKDFYTTVIPNRTPSGGAWSNKLFYCDIPRYVGDNTSDIDTERRIIKQIYISDDKIVGHNTNNLDERNDVVLRAVYEF